MGDQISSSLQVSHAFVACMWGGSTRLNTEAGLTKLELHTYDIYSGFGHDKSQAILQYSRLERPPTLFFFGDGVSGK